MMTIEKLLDGLMVSIEPFVICRTTKGPELELEAMEFASLHFVVAGTGWLIPSKQPRVRLRPGSIVILPAGMGHRLIGDGEDGTNLNIAKSCQPLALGLQAMGSTDGKGGIAVACSSINASYQRVHGLFDRLAEPVVLQPSEDNSASLVITSLLNEMADPKPGSTALISLLMKQCLVLILRHYCASGHCLVPWLSALEDPQLSSTLEKMIADPGQRFSLELLAADAGMSRSAFAQRFKTVFGRSPMNLLKDLRLQRGAHLLSTTLRPIKSIADQVGFDSRSHFSRAFTQFFASSPLEFRNKTSASYEAPSA